jgi:hypothetical protein
MDFEFKEPWEWISRLSHSDDTRVYMQRVGSIRNRVPGKHFFFIKVAQLVRLIPRQK